ncbi:MAG TPA: type IV pili methyl-accepting chemotaxis transducer N-terminal domain-containing protein, partial [Usitatibacter sp.]|nr:type IV pili methyl-accepting chemotaxis transducer N-terminal domain-containing protein [Usitatibacter sp.]
MAKAQAMKPKSSLGDWLRRLTAPKPAARPAGVPSSTVTNIPAAGGPATRGSAAKTAASAAARKPAKPVEARWSLADFRLPVIGTKPVTAQLQILGLAALVLLAGTGFMVYQDTTLRTRHATYLTIVSQMQYHTQRLAKAAGIAARGQPIAFPQLKTSRDEFAGYLGVLRNGGQAFDVSVPGAATTPEIRARLDELSKQWPVTANASTAILNAQNDLIALSRNIAQIRVGAEEMATMSQELTGLMSQSGSPPGQVVKANRLTFLSERLGRGSAEILGSETIDPEVPFLIGKDTNDLRDMIRGLEAGSEQLGLQPLRDADARAMLGELKKQFGQFEKNVSPILRELQKLVSARQASAQLVSASEQLQSSVAKLQDAVQEEKPVATLLAVVLLTALLVVVLVLMAIVFLADTRRRAAEAETENKRNQEAILRLLNEMGDLADGDLTIRAQVTEDITGAIADSMNYT